MEYFNTENTKREFECELEKNGRRHNVSIVTFLSLTLLLVLLLFCNRTWPRFRLLLRYSLWHIVNSFFYLNRLVLVGRGCIIFLSV